MNYRGTQSSTCVVDGGLQKVVRWFLDEDDIPNSHQNLITFWPVRNVPWNLHANLFYGICNKYVKTVNLLCAGNKVFVKYQAEGGSLTPPPFPYALDLLTIVNFSQRRKVTNFNPDAFLFSSGCSQTAKLPHFTYLYVGLCYETTASALQHTEPLNSHRQLFISQTTKHGEVEQQNYNDIKRWATVLSEGMVRKISNVFFFATRIGSTCTVYSAKRPTSSSHNN